MTRDERILSLTPVVERRARGLARRWRSTFEDVVGWAWITAIEVSDKSPHLDGRDLENVVALAIGRRELSRRLQQFGIRRDTGVEWVKELALDLTLRLSGPSHLLRTDARILAQQLRSKLPLRTSGPGDRIALRNRAWDITYSMVALEEGSAALAQRYSIDATLVRRIKDDTLARLALAA